MLQVADYVILEPKFSDSPERCFQLPFLACEILTCDEWPVTHSLFNDGRAAPGAGGEPQVSE